MTNYNHRQPPKTGIIYQIRNIQNGKRYVGATMQRLSRRKGHHLDLLRKGAHNHILQQDFDLYGKEAFEFTVLESGILRDDSRPKEIEWIEKLKTEYNGVLGGYQQSVTWNGIEYSNWSEAARALDIDLSSFRRRLEQGYTCDDDLPQQGIPVTWDGINYESITEAAKATGRAVANMHQLIRKGYQSESDLKRRGLVPARWNGKDFPSVSALARYLGKSPGATYWLVQNGYEKDEDLKRRQHS